MINYLSSFFYSGALIAGSKYIATWFNAALSPLLAGIPIGIIGSFFLDTENEKRRYYSGYVYSSIILAITVFLMYMTSLLFTSISMNVISVIGLFLWALISVIFIAINVVKKN